MIGNLVRKNSGFARTNSVVGRARTSAREAGHARVSVEVEAYASPMWTCTRTRAWLRAAVRARAHGACAALRVHPHAHITSCVGACGRMGGGQYVCASGGMRLHWLAPASSSWDASAQRKLCMHWRNGGLAYIGAKEARPKSARSFAGYEYRRAIFARRLIVLTEIGAESLTEGSEDADAATAEVAPEDSEVFFCGEYMTNFGAQCMKSSSVATSNEFMFTSAPRKSGDKGLTADEQDYLTVRVGACGPVCEYAYAQASLRIDSVSVSVCRYVFWSVSH
eukprot:3042729-Pleurochrysis_carterae.AAC.1